MVKGLNVAWLAATAVCLGLTGCKLQESDFSGIATNRLKYRFTSGFSPLPSYSKLDLIQDDSGRVLGVLENQNCKTNGTVSAVAYLELVNLIEKSPTIQSSDFLVDVPTETVQLTKAGVEGAIQNLSFPTAPAKYLADAAIIRNRIAAISEELQAVYGCLASPTPKVSHVRYQRQSGPVASTDITQSPMQKRLAENISLDVDFVSVSGRSYLSGSIYSQPFEGSNGHYYPTAALCQTNIKPFEIEIVDLPVLAGKIEIFQAPVTCAMAQMLEPGWRASIPALTVSDSRGDRTAQLSCLSNIQARNYLEFFKAVDSVLQKIDHCSPDPLFVR